ncbi:hypothetical protein MBLNU230_g3601t1 [Neophaeotheca triangularis]
MSGPPQTFINLPPPPSDPVTPSDVPSRSGTPNSTTTSMSELSTVAIKDGHRGHLPHHHGASTTPTSSLGQTLDAERADRISRLAGLERVTTARNPTPLGNLTPGATAPPQQAYGAGSTVSGYPNATGATPTQPLGYFDASGNPVMGRERSTVGSASATGSVGGRTTWAGSEAGELDKMSESQDMDMDVENENASSVGEGPMSEEGAASLVGFGEGARTPARQSTISSPGLGGLGGAGGNGKTPTSVREAKMIDGMSYDAGVVDTTTMAGAARGTGRSGEGADAAERIMRENMDTTSADRMHGGNAHAGDLGKFGFEK